MNLPATALIVPEPNPGVVQAGTTWVLAMRDFAKAITIENDFQAQQVGEQVGVVQRAQDATVAFRATFTGPLYGVIKRIEKGFRPYIEASNEAIEELQKRMLEYRQRVEAQKAVALPAAAKLAETMRTMEDVQQFQQLTAQGSVVIDKRVGAVVFAEKWRAVVVDARMVPVGIVDGGNFIPLWKLDEEALQRLAGPNAPVIPGVRFERYEDISQVRRGV